MHMTLEGLTLETTAYAEGADIRFTVFTYGEESCASLSALLASPERVLRLRHGDEQREVRVREHALWPRTSHRYGDMLQRHDVQLEAVRAWRLAQ